MGGHLVERYVLLEHGDLTAMEKKLVGFAALLHAEGVAGAMELVCAFPIPSYRVH